MEYNFIKEERVVAEVTDVSYSVMNGLCVSLVGYPYLYFINVNEIHSGGKNCEIQYLKKGGKIQFDNNINSKTRELHNVVILSDGIREVDVNGKLIRG